MSKTVFSRIIDGEIPSYKVFENLYAYAFLDINPLRPGHVLVVPKVAVDSFADVPEPFYSEVFQAAKKIARAQKKAFGTERSVLSVLGFDVPHMHVHVVPADSMADIDFSRTLRLSEAEMREAQERIISNL